MAFGLDALGRFRTRTAGARTDTYSYAGASETAVRITTGGTGARTLDSPVDTAGNRLGLADGTTLTWLLPDLHGSPAATLAASEATIPAAFRYDPFGEDLTGGSGSGTAVASDFGYQGRLDVGSPAAAAGPLYDAGARFYAPTIGAFTALDTYPGAAQDPLSLNRYLYAEANPATLIDPTGHVSVGQGQACSPAADLCNTSGNAINPNGGGANHHVSSSSAAPPCSPSCQSTGSSGPSSTPPRSTGASAAAGVTWDLGRVDWGDLLASMNPCGPKYFDDEKCARDLLGRADPLPTWSLFGAEMPYYGGPTAHLRDLASHDNLSLVAELAKLYGNQVDAAALPHDSPVIAFPGGLPEIPGISMMMANSELEALEALRSETVQTRPLLARQGGESQAAAAGRAIHEATDLGGVWDKEFRGILGIRPDFVNFETRTILELKPNNWAAIRAGLRQLSRYLDIFNEARPGEVPWTGQVFTYDR